MNWGLSKRLVGRAVARRQYEKILKIGKRKPLAALFQGPWHKNKKSNKKGPATRERKQEGN